MLALSLLLAVGVIAVEGAAAVSAAGLPAPLSAHHVADPAGARWAGVGADVQLGADAFVVAPALGAVVSDDGAPSSRAVLLWATGAATSTLTVPAPTTTLRVRVRGAPCQGDPAMTVLVDGVIVGSAIVPATWTDVEARGSWDSGPHRLEIRYTNDFLGAGCDRNLFVGSVTVPGGSSRPAPPMTRGFGLSQGTGPSRGLDDALATARQLGTTLDEFNFYMSWAYRESFPTTVLRRARDNGVVPSITWEPWDPAGGTDQPRYRLRTIATGAYDDYIDQWARAAAAYGGPMKIRFAHEMNGGWYPWSAAANGNTAADYRAAFRHVHDRFVAAGATAVVWVWSPNIVQGMPAPLDTVWPGAGYVDEIAVDGYNGGTDEPSMGGWRSPRQVFGPTLAEVARLAPFTPVSIAETGCAEGGGNKAQWITELFDYLRQTPVQSVHWFEFRQRADWRLVSSPSAAAAARAALGDW